MCVCVCGAVCVCVCVCGAVCVCVCVVCVCACVYMYMYSYCRVNMHTSGVFHVNFSKGSAPLSCFLAISHHSESRGSPPSLLPSLPEALDEYVRRWTERLVVLELNPRQLR